MIPDAFYDKLAERHDLHMEEQYKLAQARMLNEQANIAKQLLNQRTLFIVSPTLTIGENFLEARPSLREKYTNIKFVTPKTSIINLLYNQNYNKKKSTIIYIRGAGLNNPEFQLSPKKRRDFVKLCSEAKEYIKG